MSLRCGPSARHIYPSLVLVQPRKTRPCLTERLLMGRKESNQTNEEIISTAILLPSTDSRRVVVSYKHKYVHQVLVNCLGKLAQGKSVVM